jgi:hypothetical protein
MHTDIHALSGNRTSDPGLRASEDSSSCLRPRGHCDRHNVYGPSIIHQWLYSPLLDPGLFSSFVIIFTQTVGRLGRVIRPSQGSYLHTGQHKHRKNAHTDIHSLSGIRTHDPTVRASEDSSCLRRRSHCDRHLLLLG